MGAHDEREGPVIVKLRSRREGVHVKEQVFVGEKEGALALAGELTFRIGEWQSFGAALGLGADRMNGNLKVIYEGSEAVVKDWPEE